MQEHILIAEDDKSVAEGLKELLSDSGYRVSVAADSETALKVLQNGSVCLAVLDVRLGTDNGYELCRKIRAQQNIPILFLTACDSELELIRGFQAGGDDYVTKPFRVQELLMRIRALLRRSGRQESSVFESGALTCDQHLLRIQKADTPLELTATERKLAHALMTHCPRVLTREELLYLVWDKDAAFVEENTLNVNISRLREKLGEYEGQPYIETVRGVGYRWAVPMKR